MMLNYTEPIFWAMNRTASVRALCDCVYVQRQPILAAMYRERGREREDDGSNWNSYISKDKYIFYAEVLH